MQKLLLLGLVIAPLNLPACLSKHAGETPSEMAIRGHAQWIAEVLKEIQTIRMGMTRADLSKVFTREGGISTRTQRTYVYHGCPYIKVDVTFEAVGDEQDRLNERPEDRIVEISRPYLQWSIMN